MEHAPAGPLVMIAEMTVKPEQLQAFMDYTAANLTVSRGYPGNVAFDMLVDDAQPTSVLFYEEWESLRVQQAYMAWRVAQGDLTTLLALLVEEPTFRAFRKVAP